MKEFFTNLISSSTLASSKRFILIISGITLCGLCIAEVCMGEYVLPTTTLAGIIFSLAEMNRRENKLKIETDAKSTESQNG